MDKPPAFTVVDAGFSGSPRSLLQECVNLRKKWSGGSSLVFHTWTGQGEMYQSMTADFNRRLEAEHQRRLIIRPPVDFAEAEFDLLAINSVREFTGAERLIIEPQRVGEAMRSLTLPNADHKLSDAPIVAAVCWTLYDMSILQPWGERDSEPWMLD